MQQHSLHRDAVNKLEEEKLVNWNEQALKSAKYFLDIDTYSKEDLIWQLTTESVGFTMEEVMYALKK